MTRPSPKLMFMIRTSLLKRFAGFFLALAVTVLLSSCIPESVNPLGSPEPSAADARLEGHWRGFEAPGKSLIFTNKNAPWFHVAEIDLREEAKDDKEYNVFPTKIGKAHFLNVRAFVKEEENGAAKENKNYWFVRYEIAADGTLSIWSMDEELVEKAIKAGKLKGTVEDKKSDNEKIRQVTLKDSTANLVKFIEKSGAEKLFHNEYGKYRKAPPLDPIRIQVASDRIKLGGQSLSLEGLGEMLAKRKEQFGGDDPVVIRFALETPMNVLLQIRECALKTHPSVHLVFEQPGNPPTLKELSISDASGRILQ